MKQLFCLTVAACLALPSAARATPQDPQAPVPAITYRSAFAGYQPATGEDTTPDETWRAVNRKVGQAGGHQGHMMKMKGHQMPMEKPAARPASGGQHDHHDHQGH